MNKKDFIFYRYFQFLAKYPSEVVHKVLNGVGPAGNGHLVRDTLFYKLNLTEAANVHDFLYSEYGPKEVSRKEADDLFLESMLKKANDNTLFAKTLNKPIVYSYYFAVRAFGFLFYTKQKIDW